MPMRGKLQEDDPLLQHPPHYLHELPEEEEKRFEKLFVKLNKGGNGKIDAEKLSSALKEFGLHHRYAERFIQRIDKSQSGDINLSDFETYVREHERNLKQHFASLDKNRDGKIDLDELCKAFNELGIPLEKMEATNLLQRMDQDGSLNISYDEWRDFLLLAPSHDIHQLIKYWRHSTVLTANPRIFIWDNPGIVYSIVIGWFQRLLASIDTLLLLINTQDAQSETGYETTHAHFMSRNSMYLDIGEDMNVPDDFTPSEMQTGMWWRHLAAGGVAGAVSRTCTAPLDRLKVFLQVQQSRQRIGDCLTYMLKEGGVKGMWRGNGINVLKIAPESAIKFAAYEHIKRFIKGDSKQALGIYERFVAGALAGGISQTAIYPLEVLKTRLALRKTGQFKGIADAAYKIYSLEGLRSFYRGYVPNMLGIAPYAGIDLAVYETLKRKYLKTHSSDEQPSFWMLLACGSASSTLGQMCSYPLALIRTRLQAQVVTPTMDQASLTMSGVFRTILEREGVLGLYRGITPNFIKVMPAVSISYVVYEYTSRILGVNMT